MDPRFEIDRSEAISAVTEAVALWERAVGGALFERSEDADLRIRFVPDPHHRWAQAAERRQRELDEVYRPLTELDSELASASDVLNRQIARHNEVVAEWNAEGGAPPEVYAELELAEAALSARRKRLEARLDDLARRFAEHERGAESLARGLLVGPLRSGRYREVRSGRRISDREIIISHFADSADLVTVIAHELGHALGLGHSSDPHGVMFEVHSAPVTSLQASDLSLLRERCPALVHHGSR